MAIRSPHPDVSIPDVPFTEFVLEPTSRMAAKPALIDGPSGRIVTYGAFGTDVLRLAAGWAQRGLRKGDVVGIFSPNMPEFALAFHSVALAGGVNTTINSLYMADEVGFQLRDSDARFLVTVPAFMDRAVEASRKAGVEELFVIGQSSGASDLAGLLSDEPMAEVEIDPRKDLVALPYSSGTTGLSKGVMLTHRNLVANLCQTEAAHGLGANDILIGVLPFFHIYGLNVIMNLGIHRGATIVTMPRFELELFLRLVQDHRVTRAYLVPPIVLALAKSPEVDAFDLSSLELILCGAAPLDAQLAEACASRLGCRVIQGYGLTETSPVTNLTPDGDPTANRPGSIGPLVPNTEARVVSLIDQADVGTGVDGELWIRGPQVMAGYWKNAEATRQVIDDDGWFHTGDIGKVDSEGYFYIVDRLKELIKYKGYQVAPAELEAVLLTHPAVKDAAVIPSPDEEAGEVPKAFVVLQQQAMASEIMAFVADRVAPHKKVRRMEFVTEIPKSPSGKILRRVLVERERGIPRQKFRVSATPTAALNPEGTGL